MIQREPDSVSEDRERVLKGGRPQLPVREEIVASWHRSRGAGLTPDAFSVPYSSEIDRENRFAMAAGRVLDRLGVQLSGTGMAVILTDAHGHVLDRRTEDAQFRAQLDRILLAPGFTYAEQAAGTNAIGTALAGGHALSVQGSEHFAEVLQSMACYAAPVHHPISQRLEGLLDITCLRSDANQLALPLVQQAAREIECALYEEASTHERLLLQRFLRAMRRDRRRPVVALGDRAMITNPAAARLLLQDSAQSLSWQTLQHAALDGDASVVDVRLATGVTVPAACTPVYDGDRLAGAVLELDMPGTAGLSGDAERSAGILKGATARPIEPEPLTDREHDVLSLIAEGCANKEIARRLAIQENTVKTHAMRIFDKLGVQSRTQAALHARERGIAART